MSDDPKDTSAKAAEEKPGIIAFLGRLGNLLRPYLGACLLIFIGMLLDIGFGAVSAMSFTWILDLAIVPHDHRLLFTILGGLGIAVVIVSLAAVGQDYLYAKVGAGIANDLRVALFSHIQRLSSSFYAKTSQGDLVFRFSGDVNAIEMTVAFVLPALLRSILSFVVCLVLLFFLEWRLALLSALLLPLCLLGARVLTRKASDANDARKEEEAAATTAVQEALAGQAVIKAFGLERRFTDKFMQTTGRVVSSTLRAGFLGSLITRTSAIAINTLELAVVAMGAYFALNEWLSIGGLISFHALYMQTSLALLAVTSTLPPLLNGMASMRRIDAILAEQPRVVDRDDAVEAPRLGKAITFDDVRFSYTGERKDLNGLAFTIDAGQSVAFVGPSGSGKSTVVNMLMRFFDVESGKVTFDDVDIRGLNQSSLRSQIGLVMQESILFDTSIRENIRLGRPDATDADVEEACKAAEIHDLIVAMPQGYDTKVGERGGRLSGGQRQRIAIARAILRDPAVLVLDEATSALDAGTEAAINATLEKVATGRTVVSITHRLQSVTHADRIFVLDKGRLVEQGRHDELLAEGGLYNRLWSSQSGFVISDDGTDVTITPDRLRAIPMLETLDDKTIAAVIERFTTERHAAGSIVVHEGDAGDKFYIIVRGQVAVLKHLDGGGERHLTTMRDGDTFGEIALLKGTPRTATVRAKTECLFLTMQREPFFALLDEDPELSRAVLESADARLTRG